jgi:hypothetical protein
VAALIGRLDSCEELIGAMVAQAGERIAALQPLGAAA